MKAVFLLISLVFGLTFGCSAQLFYEANNEMQRSDCYHLPESDQERCLDKLEKAPSYEIYREERDVLRGKTN